jgi:hypothetical protein
VELRRNDRDRRDGAGAFSGDVDVYPSTRLSSSAEIARRALGQGDSSAFSAPRRRRQRGQKS